MRATLSKIASPPIDHNILTLKNQLKFYALQGVDQYQAHIAKTIALNSALIRAGVESLFANTTSLGREYLCAFIDPALDQSIISHATQKEVESVVDASFSATDVQEAQITMDQLELLVHALDYAKYTITETQPLNGVGTQELFGVQVTYAVWMTNSKGTRHRAPIVVTPSHFVQRFETLVERLQHQIAQSPQKKALLEEISDYRNSMQALPQHGVMTLDMVQLRLTGRGQIAEEIERLFIDISKPLVDSVSYGADETNDIIIPNEPTSEWIKQYHGTLYLDKDRLMLWDQSESETCINGARITKRVVCIARLRETPESIRINLGPYYSVPQARDSASPSKRLSHYNIELSFTK